jgi:methionine-rich copper-binding protein CopC
VTTGRAALFLVLLSGLLLMPGTARAHSELESSRPAEGARQKKPPDHIVLRFSEVPAEDSIVKVSDECTKNLVDDSFVAGNAFHAQLVGGTGGKYVVEYALISAEDGHPTRGTFSFTVKGPADCSADEPDDTAGNADGDAGNGNNDDGAAPDTEPTGDEDDSSSPMIPIALGGLGAIAIAAIARLATRK